MEARRGELARARPVDARGLLCSGRCGGRRGRAGHLAVDLLLRVRRSAEPQSVAPEARMKRGSARGASIWGGAAILPAAGAPLYFTVPEPWGALLWFYLFLAAGALAGASLARSGFGGPVAFRFGAAFSIPAAILPFSILPADRPSLVVATAAAWGLALGAAAALGALLSGSRLAAARGSRLRVGARAGAAFLTGGALAGALAPVLIALLPPRGYFVAWSGGLIAAFALGGGLLERKG